MRTSHLQYVTMVEFMERHGDLSKPTGGPRGRHFIQMKWKELAEKLNSDGTGDSRSEEKWRKVWSDFKNNTKRKQAKISRAASGTGGGPALQLSLTDLESRVMQIIRMEAATGMVVVVEAGFQQTEDRAKAHSQPEELIIPDPQPDIDNDTELGSTTAKDADWNTPSTSNPPNTTAPPDDGETAAPPSTSKNSVSDEHWTPPAQKKKKNDSLAKLFVDSDKTAREYAKERDLAYERLETERLRLRDYELRERVRQRDQELHLQAQWLEFMKEAMNVIIRYFERQDKR